MFGVVREFQAPLGVTHAVRGRFGPSSNSLGVVFARKNSLDIYVVRASKEMAHLELLQSTPLGANILSMCNLRRSNTPGDLLLIGFDNMRIAIMAWDHDTRSWITLQTLDLGLLLGSKLCSPSSITRSHDPLDYGRPLLRGRHGQYNQPLIRADPSGRCFAVLAKEQNAVYIIPVHADDDSAQPDAKVVHRNDIFLIDLPTDYEARNIKDFSFLHGSFEPNIVVLHEPKRTWSGRAAIQRNTCCLLSLSVDIRSKRPSKTWTMDQLPYDAQRVEPIPESAGGGVLVVSTSLLMQVRHGACVAGLSLNCFGDSYSTEMKGKYDTITQSDTLVECDAAHCRFLDFEERFSDAPSGMQCIALLSLKGGELYFLNLAVGSRSTLIMKRAGSTVIASEIIPINERFFALASRLSDSLLIEYQRALDDSGNDQSAKDKKKRDKAEKPGAPKAKSSKKKKRKRTAEEEAEYEMIYGTKLPQESSDEESDEDTGKQSALELEDKDEGTRGVYDDEDELGWVFNSGPESEAHDGAESGSGSWALKVKDTITCFGPGADLAVGASPDDAANTKLDMVIAGGYAKNGCLAVVHQSIRPRNHVEFDVPGCDGIWALHDPAVAKAEKVEREQNNAAISLRNAARRARNTKKLAARKRFVDEAVQELEKSQSPDQAPDKPAEDSIAGGDAGSNGQHTSQNDKSPPNPSDSDEGTENAPTGAQVTKLGGISDPIEKEDGEEGEETGPPAKKRKMEGSDEADPAANSSSEKEISEEVKAQIEQQAEENYPLESEESLEEATVDEGALHSYMLLSRASATTVIKTGAFLDELVGGASDFATKEKTVAAGNILGNHAMVQVVPSGVKVLKDGRSQCEYKASGPSTIQYAQVADPLILIQTADGSVKVLEVSAEKFEERSDTDANKVDSASAPNDLFDDFEISLGGGHESETLNEISEVKQNREPSNPTADQNGVNKVIIDYRNLSIGIVYPIGADGASPMISTAYLYKGPLAQEVAEGGILTTSLSHEADVDAAAPGRSDIVGLAKEEDSADSSKEAPKSVPGENGGKEQTEDEDRMLYGDHNEDEEDFMLYGSGAGEENRSKTETPSAAVPGQEGIGMVKGEQNITADGELQEGKRPLRATAPTPEKGVIAVSGSQGAASNDGHLLVLCEMNGNLVVISPSLDWQVVLECPAFFAAPSLVRDSPLSEEDKTNGTIPFASPQLRIEKIGLVELSGSALLAGLSTPVLIAIPAIGIPLIYRAFMCSKPPTPRSRSRLCLHRILSKDRAAALLAKSISCARSNPPGVRGKDMTRPTAMIHFRNIAGRSGVFIGGSCPLFLFAERGYPRIHALSHTNTTGASVCREEYDMGQEVLAFSEFHNVKCPRGFVAAGKDGVVRICSLPPPSVMNYDSPTPMRKIALRCTPHKVAYHAGSATYGVLASMPTLTTREERLARILQSLEKHDKRHYQHTAAQAEAETGDDKANRVPPLFEELHELRVYRPDTWELIKSHKLQKGEVGLAIANMTVDVYKQKTAASGADIPSSKKGDDGNESAFAASSKMRPKDLLVIGTGHLNGEDASSRGRLLMFEISKQEVYTEAGGMFTAFQLQLIAEKELFSPVTAVASMEGYVIAGVGPQVSVYKLVGDEIIHLSFAFGQLYCTSLASIKQYLVAADMCKSVTFMYFRDRNNSVNFLGKDYDHVTSFATEFLIENENISIVVSDGNGNLQLMNYAHASVPESRGGKRLLVNGGTQFGSRINKFVRVRAPDRRVDMQKGRANNKAGEHALLFTTLDGGIGALMSVTEVQFRKMRLLREHVLKHSGIVRQAGVNPSEQTSFRPESASTVLLDQRLLDSRAIFDIFGTTLVEMSMVARQSGMDVVGMARTMMGLDAVVARF